MSDRRRFIRLCMPHLSAGAASGACGVFGGRVVPAKGWCSASVKKAG